MKLGNATKRWVIQGGLAGSGAETLLNSAAQCHNFVNLDDGL